MQYDHENDRNHRQSTSEYFSQNYCHNENKCLLCKSGFESNSCNRHPTTFVDNPQVVRQSRIMCLNNRNTPIDFNLSQIEENIKNRKSDVQHEKSSQLSFHPQSQYKQTSIRPFCKVTQHGTLANAKRFAFSNITNTCVDSDSPKSRLAALKKSEAKLVKNVPTVSRQPIRNQSRKRTCHEENKELVDVQKRCRNAVSKNVFNHVDISTIPPSARALHRVHSASILETSWLSDKDSPDQLDSYSLITVKKPQIPDGAFASISGKTLKNLLESMSRKEFQRKFILIDCRYPYEYNGGHIQNAINIYDTSKIVDFFYPKDRTEFLEINSKIPIFYCEFSQKRGPSMAMELRRQDRMRNQNRYPNIDYKEIYILDHGFKKFFVEDKFTAFCDPSNYKPMLHPDHINELTNYRFHKKTYSATATEKKLLQNANNSKVPFTRKHSADSSTSTHFVEDKTRFEAIHKYRELKQKDQEKQKQIQVIKTSNPTTSNCFKNNSKENTPYKKNALLKKLTDSNKSNNKTKSLLQCNFLIGVSPIPLHSSPNFLIGQRLVQKTFQKMSVCSPIANNTTPNSCVTSGASTASNTVIVSSECDDQSSSPFSLFSRRSLFCPQTRATNVMTILEESYISSSSATSSRYSSLSPQ